MEFLKAIRTNMLFSAIFTIILGLLFTIDPFGASATIARILGIVMFLGGIVELILYAVNRRYNPLSNGSLVIGLSLLVLGLFTMTHTSFVLSLIFLIISVFVIISGVISLNYALQIRRHDLPGWGPDVILSILILIVGVSMLFHPFSALKNTFLFIGILLLVKGIFELYMALHTPTVL